jgi:hypothetical protein
LDFTIQQALFLFKPGSAFYFPRRKAVGFIRRRRLR